MRQCAELLGISSCRNPSRFAPSSTFIMLSPVTLPPGRLKLATRPSCTGSAPGHEDNWYCCRCGLNGKRRCRAEWRDDNGHAMLDQIGSQLWEPILVSSLHTGIRLPRCDLRCSQVRSGHCGMLSKNDRRAPPCANRDSPPSALSALRPRPAIGHVPAAPASSVMNSRHLMCGWPPPGKR